MNPVKVNVENINTTGDFSSAPAVFFTPIWISSLLGSILLFYFGRKESNSVKGKSSSKNNRNWYYRISFYSWWLISTTISRMDFRRICR